MNPDLCLKPIPWATSYRCQAEKGHDGQCSHHHRDATKPEYVQTLEDLVAESVATRSLNLTLKREDHSDKERQAIETALLGSKIE